VIEENKGFFVDLHGNEGIWNVEHYPKNAKDDRTPETPSVCAMRHE
jgi:hypothetical protein